VVRTSWIIDGGADDLRPFCRPLCQRFARRLCLASLLPPRSVIEWTETVLVVRRTNGSAYEVLMCAICLSETDLRSSPSLLPHELIDARNGYRAHHRLTAKQLARRPTGRTELPDGCCR
jgi:hypothetical protein